MSHTGGQTTALPTRGWCITDWLGAYRHGQQPRELLLALHQCLSPEHSAWISLVDEQALLLQIEQVEQRLAQLGNDTTKLPLFCVPFAVKDNIDAAGLDTTAACPAFAYRPRNDAGVVARLRDAGAILIGKTNLDQFATGLVGTRSPYGAVGNSFNPDYIAGGSSSGSAVVVAEGLVPFALGTDTAGSGRVPAGMNNIVGLKPSRGLLSTQGVIPACRSLDCVSVFALTVTDAEQILSITTAFDAADPYSRIAPASSRSALPARPRLGIPDQPQHFGDAHAAAAFATALDNLRDDGCELVALDFAPLHELAALLYEGPWVAERFIVIEELLHAQPEAIHPVVRDIVGKAPRFSAVDAFKAEYRRMELVRHAQQLMEAVDALVVPTTPAAFRIEAIEADPIRLNSQLGTYTNFVNLADWCALALPAGLRADGLPFGITLIAPTWHDRALAHWGRGWQRRRGLPLGATGRALPRQADAASSDVAEDSLQIAVVGAHLSGMPLNGQLTERNAILLEQTRTAPNYRLFALPGTTPPKPGLIRCDDGGSIIVELWRMPLTAFGSFVALIPPPLGIGTLELEDGRLVKGFICEGRAAEGARDITDFGGWRAYIASLHAKP